MRVDPNSKDPARGSQLDKTKPLRITMKAVDLALSHNFAASFKGKSFDADWTRNMKPTSTAGKAAKLWRPQVHAYAPLKAARVTNLSFRG